MKYLAAALMLAAPAGAEVITAENCAFPTHGKTFVIDCDFTNHGAEAIAAFRYSVLVTQEGRDVPWLDTRGGPNPASEIPGGLEPGETLRLPIVAGSIPIRAEIDALQLSVTPYGAKDAQGAEIADQSAAAVAEISNQ